jgi:tetratricopeptide (TPR) repeat protein
MVGLVICGITACGDGKGSKGDEGKAGPIQVTPDGPQAKPLTDLDDDALAERYLAVRQRLEHDPKLAMGDGFAEVSAQLSEIANAADDPHLRANAALLLGSLYEARGDAKTAAAHYRHAAKLVPDDAGPWMALAVASAAAEDLPAAVQAQARATELDPDNLENWLALGELQIRAGNKEEAAKVYAGYEQRRKGLIDGLTLRHPGGDFMIGEDERVGCAEALASAADAGTAAALVYSIAHDPSPKVREAVARAMGLHRLTGYTETIDAALKAEKVATVTEALTWAKAEIVRDPIDVAPGTRAVLPADDPRHADPKDLPPADVPPAPSGGEGGSDTGGAEPAKDSESTGP